MVKNQKSDSETKKCLFRKFSGKKADFPNLKEDCVTFFNTVKSQYIGDYAQCFYEKFRTLAETAKTNKTVFYPIMSKHPEDV